MSKTIMQKMPQGKSAYSKRNKTCEKKEIKASCLPHPTAPLKMITKKQYEYLKERSHVTTKEEKQLALDTAEKEKERLIRESIMRKEAIRRMDLQKTQEKDPKTKEIEQEAREKVMHVLERAHNIRLEREEEIQQCNRLILETKCRAIRDAQLNEKRLIKREFHDEEQRLNNMMEDERRWAIKEEFRKEQKEAVKRLHFAKALKEQIVKNEEQQILAFERKQEESRLIDLSNIAREQDEIEKVREREIENARIRHDLTEAYEQTKQYKAMEIEEDKIIDARIKEYQRKKDEMKAKELEKQQLERLRVEKKKAMIVEKALQTRELQVHIDDINAARIQEEIEREWRQKEKEEALKRVEAQKMLWNERQQQINDKHIMQAMEIERERREFERIVREQEEAFYKEKKALEQKQQRAFNLRNEILQQINEKEQERITERQKIFQENLAIREEAEIRKKKLQNMMKQKCQKMKEDNVPDIYINEVKRMIENIQ